MAATSSRRKRARGSIETLPSGALRVAVYAGARVQALLHSPIPTRPLAALPTLTVVLIGAAALIDATGAFTRVLTALLG